MALDAQAMRANRPDVRANVSGSVTPDNPRNSLTKLPEPLGLTVEACVEVVFATSKMSKG